MIENDDFLFSNFKSDGLHLNEGGVRKFAGILVGDTNCDFKNDTNANSKKLKLLYSEYQIEKLI